MATKVTASMDSGGTAISTFNCTTEKTATGQYTVTFSKPFRDTKYVPSVVCSVSNAFATFTGVTTTTMGIQVKNNSGTLVDAPVAVKISGNYSILE